MLDQATFILTKIIATVGPSCSDVPTLAKLIEHGVRVFRINFSHGTADQFAQSLKSIREAEKQTGAYVGVLGDLSGPKLRVGKVQDGGVMLYVGDQVIFQRKTIVGAADMSRNAAGVFSTTTPAIISDVQPGQRLLVDDGNVRMIVSDKRGRGDDEHLICNVTTGGLVTSAKGINLPETQLNLPSLTDHDQRCLEWASKNEIDFLALSFVRKAGDVEQLRSRLRQLNADIPIVAKIEKPQAIDELDAILEVSNAVMVARGDLGVEMDLARVPVIQKRIIRMAHQKGRPVVVATQMLQSMIDLPTPTRAEVSDVANAIYDGADAVMLSGETAVGKYPEHAVRMMARIATITHDQIAAEQLEMDLPARVTTRPRASRYRTAALAQGVTDIVRQLHAKLIVIWSQKGGGALFLSQNLLSQNRISVPIIAASSERQVLRRMGPLFAVIPVLMDKPASIEAFIRSIDELILERKWGEQGDAYVIVAGEPIGTPRVTNTISIRYLGDACRVDFPNMQG